MSKRLKQGDRLVLATHNAGKHKEFIQLLSPYGIDLHSAADHSVPEPEETGKTFIENAKLKAQLCAEMTALPALADDSGLCVDALDGEPGIYSARWAGSPRNFNAAMQKVLELIPQGATRKAHFTCALSLVWPDGSYQNFEGYCHGEIAHKPKGQEGFGYDPIFIPDGYEMSFGQFNSHDKDRISHRADAFSKLAQAVLPVLL